MDTKVIDARKIREGQRFQLPGDDRVYRATQEATHIGGGEMCLFYEYESAGGMANEGMVFDAYEPYTLIAIK